MVILMSTNSNSFQNLFKIRYLICSIFIFLTFVCMKSVAVASNVSFRLEFFLPISFSPFPTSVKFLWNVSFILICLSNLSYDLFSFVCDG